MPIFSDEYGKESSLLFLGKHGVKEFEERFDFYYDKYRDISNKRGFFGEINFEKNVKLICKPNMTSFLNKYSKAI